MITIRKLWYQMCCKYLIAQPLGQNEVETWTTILLKSSNYKKLFSHATDVQVIFKKYVILLFYVLYTSVTWNFFCIVSHTWMNAFSCYSRRECGFCTMCMLLRCQIMKRKKRERGRKKITPQHSLWSPSNWAAPTPSPQTYNRGL